MPRNYKKLQEQINFDQRADEGRNLQTIYHIGAIPGDTQVRTALNPIGPQPLRQFFVKLSQTLDEAGLVKQHRF